MPDPLSPDLLEKMHAYWRAANYLSVGQIYLADNPLLETPLKLEHIKTRLLGHWGTTTGLNAKICYGCFHPGPQWDRNRDSLRLGLRHRATGRGRLQPRRIEPREHGHRDFLL